jgi:hypothetical protein
VSGESELTALLSGSKFRGSTSHGSVACIALMFTSLLFYGSLITV